MFRCSNPGGGKKVSYPNVQTGFGDPQTCCSVSIIGFVLGFRAAGARSVNQSRLVPRLTRTSPLHMCLLGVEIWKKKKNTVRDLLPRQKKIINLSEGSVSQI